VPGTLARPAANPSTYMGSKQQTSMLHRLARLYNKDDIYETFFPEQPFSGLSEETSASNSDRTAFGVNGGEALFTEADARQVTSITSNHIVEIGWFYQGCELFVVNVYVVYSYSGLRSLH